MIGLINAVDEFLNDLKARHPGETFYCPFVKKMAEELPKAKNSYFAGLQTGFLSGVFIGMIGATLAFGAILAAIGLSM